MKLSFRQLAWLMGLWPIVVVHTAYVISAQAELVPWCLPYVEGCTSISRAARHGAANIFFKLSMLPYVPLLAYFWWRAAALSSARSGWMRAAGLTGTAFLLLYVIFLGIEGDIYQWLRRFGITFYFGMTLLALMLLARRFRDQARALVALCWLMLGLGLASIPLQHLALDRDAAVNALEWSYALLMMLAFIATKSLEQHAAQPG